MLIVWNLSIYEGVIPLQCCPALPLAYPSSKNTMTILLTLAGLAGFVLFYKSIEVFDKL